MESNGGTETGRISLYVPPEIEEPTDETTLEAPRIHYFRASPEHIDGPEGETILSWEVTDATSATIDGIGSVEVPMGSIDRWVEQTTPFILRATNDAGILDVRTVIVTVEGETEDLPIIHSFTAYPDNISAGEESTLRWDVSGVNIVTIKPEIGIMGSAGEEKVSPDESTTYILTATNEVGISDVKTVTVTVEKQMPELSVNPRELNFGTLSVRDEESLEFEISNDGGGTLEWDVRDIPDWIKISPLYGNSGTVTVITNTAKLDAGTYYRKIVIHSNGGKEYIPVTLRIIMLPTILSVYPDELNFGNISVGDEKSLEFEISNDGDGTLKWNVKDKPEWIVINPINGNSGTVYVTAAPNPKIRRKISYRGIIEIDSNGGNVSIPVTFTTSVKDDPT